MGVRYNLLMTSISTKTGDTGTSALANGQRLAKTDPIFALLGDLDELNSWLGLIITQTQLIASLQTIQKNLYLISAMVAKSKKVVFTAQNLQELESEAKKLEKKLANNWHRNFLYPGGTKLAAYLDLSRAVCRRAERVAWSLPLLTRRGIKGEVFSYLNRLSDYLYLLRCWANQQAKQKEREF